MKKSQRKLINNIRKEFVVSYLMLQEKLKLKQIKLKKSLEDYSDAKERLKVDLEKFKQEKTNKNGVCENSNLKLTINSILYDKNFFRNAPKSFVVIKCEGVESNTTLKENSYEPVWNELLEFPITKLDQTIEITIRDQSAILGTVMIPLRTFENQTKIEEIFSISNKDCSEFGKLIIKGQLLWSSYVLHKNNYDKILTRISELENELGLLEKYCSLIENPFGILLCGEIEEILTTKLHEINQIDLASSRKSIFPGRASVLPKFRNTVLGSLEDSRKKGKIYC